jgi:hypothetical protein
MTNSGPLEDTPWVTHPVMCAFCGDSVETAHPDPCALIVVTNWRGPDEGQQEQQFFAHAACMLTSLHPKSLRRPSSYIRASNWVRSKKVAASGPRRHCPVQHAERRVGSPMPVIHVATADRRCRLCTPCRL